MKSKFLFLMIVIILSGFIYCTEDAPLSPILIPGKIVGIVKPTGIKADVALKQGNVTQTTNADSLTGYFEFNRVTPGVYNIEFSAQGYGRQVLNEIIVYENRTTTTPDVILKPLPEQILTITPANGAQSVSVDAPIQIEFCVFMNQASAENNFSISPGINGYFRWDNNPDGSTMYFYPETQYATNKTYSFSLNHRAKTIYGDTLSFDVSSFFTTESFKLIATIPEDQSSYISPQTEIYLTFNSQVNRRSLEDSIKFYPILMGDFRWLDARRVAFKPGFYLASNSDYLIYNLDQVKDIYGSFLSGRNSFSFRTEPLRVVSNYPSNGATHVSRSTSIIITFNTAVNQTAVESSFSIVPKPENWYFQWTDLTRLQYTGTTPLSPNTLYSVTLQDTICVDKWQNPLPADFRFLFQTGE